MIESLLGDLRYALRGMRNNPGFTAAAVAMLALGLGINALVFTVANAVLFKGFPLVEANDRIVYMTSGQGCCVSYADFEDWRAAAQSFEGMAIVHGVQQTFAEAGGLPETQYTTEVSADTFRIAGVEPLLGRDFLPADEQPGAARVAILDYGFWESRFAKNPDVVGRAVRIGGEPATVIGVMPRGFSFPQNQSLWVPLLKTQQALDRGNRATWFVFGRLKDGVTADTARAEIEGIAKRLEGAYPDTNRNTAPFFYNFHEFFIGPNATTIYQAMLGAVAFVLLIACANLANLLLARAAGRSREISVRVALGASRWRVSRQLLIESVSLAIVSGWLGLLIAKLGVRLFAVNASGPSLTDAIGSGGWFDNVLDYSMDSRALAYLAAISIGTGLLFGLAPALKLAKLDVSSSLKDGSRGATGGSRGKRLSGLLVTGEVVLAIVLLGGAGVMLRSFLNIYSADMGFKADNVLINLSVLPSARYPGAESQTAFFAALQTRLTELPGVESVAIASRVPTDRTWPVPYELDGAPAADPRDGPRVAALAVSPKYFATLDAPLSAGRDFGAADTPAAAPVAIVNRLFAEATWPGEDPIGKRVRMFAADGAPEAWLTVVGVAPNIAQNDRTRQRTDPLLYRPYLQAPVPEMWTLIRAAVPATALASALRTEMQRLDPDLPMSFGPFVLDEYLADAYRYRGVTGALFFALAAVALLLASLGLYAVVAHSVGQRTQELGIRLAIGATARDIFKLVLRQGMAPLALGLVIGVAASLAVNRVLQAQLVEVSPGDPLTYAVAIGVLVSAAAAGCVIPARRAMRVDPVVTLRHD